MTVEQRLERLERTNRRLTGLLAAVCLIFASVFLMGQARFPQAMEAESITLKDRRGVDIARFGIGYPEGSNVGEASLNFYTYLPDGSRSSTTGFHGGMGDEAGLQLSGPSGTVFLRTNVDGRPMIRIIDGSGIVFTAP